MFSFAIREPASRKQHSQSRLDKSPAGNGKHATNALLVGSRAMEMLPVRAAFSRDLTARTVVCGDKYLANQTIN